MRGKGMASRLAKAALTDLHNSGDHYIATCPYVVSWLKKHHLPLSDDDHYLFSMTLESFAKELDAASNQKLFALVAYVRLQVTMSFLSEEDLITLSFACFYDFYGQLPTTKVAGLRELCD